MADRIAELERLLSEAGLTEPLTANIEDAECDESIAIEMRGSQIATVLNAEEFPCIEPEDYPKVDARARATALLLAAAVNALPALLRIAELFVAQAPQHHSPACAMSTLPPEFGGPVERSCDCGKSEAEAALQALEVKL